MTAELSEHLRRLVPSVGVWEGEERLADPNGPPGARIIAKGQSEARLAVGGAVLATDYRQTIGGKDTMQGHAVTIWSSRDGRYRMYFFDSSGGDPSVFQGNMTGDTLVLEGEGPNGSRIRHRTDHPDGETMRTRSDMTFDGESWTEVFEGVYRRLDGSPSGLRL